MLRYALALLVLAVAFFAPADAIADSKILHRDLEAGDAHTDSTDETVLTSAELPAYSLQRGKVYRVHGAVIATATNSTDTLTVQVRIGPTTLTGTVVGSSGAVDVADDDVVIIDLWLTVRDADSASTVIVDGWVSAAGAEGTATARVAYQSLSLDWSVAQLIEITGDWSVASASNSCRSDSLVVSEHI